MDDIWFTLRVINFALYAVTFMLIVYKGVFIQVSQIKIDYLGLCLTIHIFLGGYIVAEALVQHTEGGSRVWITTVLVIFTLLVVLFKFDSKFPLKKDSKHD